MTEDDAKALIQRVGGEKGLERTAAFLAMVTSENQHQNLIAPSTVETIWVRHAADSAQLVRYCPPSTRTWLDIGTGGGFPGLVVALLTSCSMTLVEPRRRRAEFLRSCVAAFDLQERVAIEQHNVECLEGTYDVISARAVAPLRKLLQNARHCAKIRTRWVLPRGHLTRDDEAVLEESHAVFHVEQSLTDDESAVLLIDQVTI